MIKNYVYVLNAYIEVLSSSFKNTCFKLEALYIIEWLFDMTVHVLKCARVNM